MTMTLEAINPSSQCFRPLLVFNISLEIWDSQRKVEGHRSLTL